MPTATPLATSERRWPPQRDYSVPSIMASAGAQFAQFLRAAGKGRIRMKTYLASGLLAGTILGGALGLAHPALAQTATPPECPPVTVPGTGGACNPADTSQGTGTQPETTTP